MKCAFSRNHKMFVAQAQQKVPELRRYLVHIEL